MTKRRKRRAFTPEFESDAVKLCLAGGRTVAQVAMDRDLTETAQSSCLLRMLLRKTLNANVHILHVCESVV